jgi:hypothetical protein
MNPFLADVIGSLVRFSLTTGAGWLVSQGYIEAGSAAAIVGLGLSLWQKYTARTKLVTALASPAGTTEATVEKKIAQGEQPSVNTPKTEKPVLND